MTPQQAARHFAAISIKYSWYLIPIMPVDVGNISFVFPIELIL